MKSAMHILEGQAYFPEVLVKKEVQRVGYLSESFPQLRAHRDDGTENGEEQTDDVILAGQPVGISKMAKQQAKQNFRFVKDANEDATKRFHGAGSRFIEDPNGEDSLVGRCEKFLPASAKIAAAPYKIQVDKKFRLV